MPPMARAAHTRWWQIAEVMFGIPVLVAIGLQVLLPVHLPYGQFAPIAVATGSLLGLASVVLIIAARRELARHGQPTDPGLPTRHLVTTGVFAWSRNPLYLSAVLLLIGIALAGNLPWLIAALLPAVGLCHALLIIPEERSLAAAFGSAYQAYAGAVPRWAGLRQRHR
jgi:protein-S-isoprenylcysteine O-methyltransferase Ste14